jgi:hypothetical protein
LREPGFVPLQTVVISMFPVKGIGRVRSPQALHLRSYLRIGDALFAAQVKKLSDLCMKLRRKVHLNPFDTWVFRNRQDWGSFLVEVFNLFLSFRNKKDEQ